MLVKGASEIAGLSLLDSVMQAESKFHATGAVKVWTNQTVLEHLEQLNLQSLGAANIMGATHSRDLMSIVFMVFIVVVVVIIMIIIILFWYGIRLRI